MSNITVQDLIQREVIYCVSALIYELTSKEGALDEELRFDLWRGPVDYEAAEYAMDDCEVFEEDGCFGIRETQEPAVVEIKPTHTTEEAAIQDWFNANDGAYDTPEDAMEDYVTFEQDGRFGVREAQDDAEVLVDPSHNDEEDAIKEWYEDNNEDLREYESEVFEHWIVTDWLAKKLADHGETVVDDLYGLTIWCRTTTGQAIYMDYVITKIHQELISK